MINMQEGPESEHVAAVSLEALLATVASRVREARKRAKLSQDDLAKAIGSGQSYIFQIEKGTANITLKTLVRLAAAMSLDPSDLLPAEHSRRVAGMLRTTMLDLDRITAQLRQVYELVADDPSAHISDAPPEQ